jgi:hypothetical protein
MALKGLFLISIILCSFGVSFSMTPAELVKV